MNNKGKTLTIFLVVISILLLSLTVITMFFFQKESELRKAAETELKKSRDSEAKLQADLKEAKKQAFILEEKAKESDEKLSDLQSELDLVKGVRDQIKEENSSLKTALESETQSKQQIRDQLTKELTAAKQKVTELEGMIASEKKEQTELQEKIKTLEEKAKEQAQQTSIAPPAVPSEAIVPGPGPVSDPAPETPRAQNAEQRVQLGTIIVTPDQVRIGKVLSVDQENEFVIFDLGEKDGVAPGTMLAIYRDQDYLGDVKASKVQADMAAADFVPPFSSEKVRKNDQVVFKK